MYSAYSKKIPAFYKKLLNHLNKVNIFDLPECDNVAKPHNHIHYHPTKDGINIFTSKIIKLSHELSHILEARDNSRLVQIDFGIKKYFPTTQKGQLVAIACEARTRGIQTKLIEIAFGRHHMLYHRLADTLVSPPGPIGKFKNNKEVVDWSYNITRSAYNYWSEDKILLAWKEKAMFINNWLNS